MTNNLVVSIITTIITIIVVVIAATEYGYLISITCLSSLDVSYVTNQQQYALLTT